MYRKSFHRRNPRKRRSTSRRRNTHLKVGQRVRLKGGKVTGRIVKRRMGDVYEVKWRKRRKKVTGKSLMKVKSKARHNPGKKKGIIKRSYKSGIAKKRTFKFKSHYRTGRAAATIMNSRKRQFKKRKKSYKKSYRRNSKPFRLKLSRRGAYSYGIRKRGRKGAYISNPKRRRNYSKAKGTVKWQKPKSWMESESSDEFKMRRNSRKRKKAAYKKRSYKRSKSAAFRKRSYRRNSAKAWKKRSYKRMARKARNKRMARKRR